MFNNFKSVKIRLVNVKMHKYWIFNQGEALYIIKTLVLHIISGKATVSHQADKGIHTYGVMIYAA